MFKSLKSLTFSENLLRQNIESFKLKRNNNDDENKHFIIKISNNKFHSKFEVGAHYQLGRKERKLKERKKLKKK